MIGSAFGTRKKLRFTYTGNLDLKAGANIISLLSIAVGLPVSIPIPTSIRLWLSVSETLETWCQA